MEYVKLSEWSQLNTLIPYVSGIDITGKSSQPHIGIIGDGGGIGGAVAAALKGRLAVQPLAHILGRHTLAERDKATQAPRRQLQREMAFRRFIDLLYRPSDALRLPEQDEVLVCRCEEVSVGEIRRAVSQGCMGPCQSRLCGSSADLHRRSFEDMMREPYLLCGIIHNNSIESGQQTLVNLLRFCVVQTGLGSRPSGRLSS